MPRVICCFLLVLVFGSWANGSEPSWKGRVRHPRIIANVERTGLTAAIPTTTIFTPKHDGFYRVFVYMVMTKPTTAESFWLFCLNWTDDAGPEQWRGTPFNGASGPFLWAESTPPTAYNLNDYYSLAFRANAGIPVTYNTSADGNTQGSVYELFFTIEWIH